MTRGKRGNMFKKVGVLLISITIFVVLPVCVGVLTHSVWGGCGTFFVLSGICVAIAFLTAKEQPEY
jgi:uncharacterized membrane protein